MAFNPNSQTPASATSPGFLSSADWNTFNSKQPAGNYISALTGDVTATGPGSVAAIVAKIRGVNVSSTAPTNGQVLTYNSTSLQWEPQASAASGANTSLSNLASTAINSSLVPASNNSIDVGSPTLNFNNGYLTNIFTSFLNFASTGISQLSGNLVLTNGANTMTMQSGITGGSGTFFSGPITAPSPWHMTAQSGFDVAYSHYQSSTQDYYMGIDNVGLFNFVPNQFMIGTFQATGSFNFIANSSVLFTVNVGSLDAHNRPILNVTDPTNPQDAATKNYVDTHIGSGSSGANGIVQLSNGVGGFTSSTALRYDTTHGTFWIGGEPSHPSWLDTWQVVIKNAIPFAIVSGFTSADSGMLFQTGAMGGNATNFQGVDGTGATKDLQFQNSGGNSYFQGMLLAQKIGVVNTSPVSVLSNTNVNINASDNIGINPALSLAWINNGPGYVAGFYNQDVGSDRNGLAVKIADSAATALDVSQGASQSTAGSSLFRVHGNGIVEVPARLGIKTSTPVFGWAMTVLGDIAGAALFLSGLTSGDSGFAIEVGPGTTNIQGTNGNETAAVDISLQSGGGNTSISPSGVTQTAKIHSTGSHVDAIRVVTGNDTLSATSDYKIVANQPSGGAFTLSLPAGATGLNFILTQAATNTATFTITPNGVDTLDANIQTLFNANQPVPITFVSGTWYAV